MNKYINQIVENHLFECGKLLTAYILDESEHINDSVQEVADMLLNKVENLNTFDYGAVIYSGIAFNTLTKTFFRTRQQSSKFIHRIYFEIEKCDNDNDYAFSDRVDDDLYIVIYKDKFCLENDIVDIENLFAILVHETQHIFDMCVDRDRNILYDNVRNNVLKDYIETVDKYDFVDKNTKDAVYLMLMLTTGPEQRARINATYKLVDNFYKKKPKYEQTETTKRFYDELKYNYNLYTKNCSDDLTDKSTLQHIYICSVLSCSDVKISSQLFNFNKLIILFRKQLYKDTEKLYKLFGIYMLRHKSDLMLRKPTDYNISTKDIEKYVSGGEIIENKKISVKEFIHSNIFHIFKSFEDKIYNAISKALDNNGVLYFKMKKEQDIDDIYK